MEPLADPVDGALPAEFGIYTVAQDRSELADAIDAPGLLAHDAFVIDARHVEQIDAAALQLLVVLAAELRRRGLRLRLLEPSAALERAIRRLGAAPALGLPPVALTDLEDSDAPPPR
jgi:anti-anti-sigma regulatory factor